MTVASILKTKGNAVETASAADTLHDVVRKLEAHGIGAVVVTDADKRVEGILSERDVVRSLARKGPGVLEQPVTSHMTKDVVTCAPHDLIDHVMEKMSAGKFRHMPVVEGGKLTGIISIGDVVKHKLAQAESETAMLRDYVAMT
ncbi:MAG: CBS domain-containing protein [Pseudomonadota bacterium]